MTDDVPLQGAAIAAGASGLPPRSIEVPYEDVRPAIRPGDVLLFRGRGLVSALIGGLGRSRYSHAALAVRVQADGAAPRLLVAEFRELRGGRAVLLSKAIEGAAVDLYRVNLSGVEGLGLSDAEVRRRVADKAWGKVLEARPYSYWTIVRLVLGRLPLFLLRRLPFLGRRLPFRTWSEDDRADPKGFVCSVFVSWAWRTAGLVDLVPNLADDSTEPGDLARSGRLEYAGTLTPDGSVAASR